MVCETIKGTVLHVNYLTLPYFGTGREKQSNDKKAKLKGHDGKVTKHKPLLKAQRKLSTKHAVELHLGNRGFRTAEKDIRTVKMETNEVEELYEMSDLEESESGPESASSCEVNATAGKAEKPKLKSIAKLKETSGQGEVDITAASKTAGEKRRYILFVGNLPYTATSDDIIAHFKRRGVPVKEVRLLTRRDSEQSRGCCFVEFDSAKTVQVSWRST